MYRTNYYVAPKSIKINKLYLRYRYLKYCLNIKKKKIKRHDLEGFLFLIIFCGVGIAMICFMFELAKEGNQKELEEQKQKQIYQQNQFNHCEPYHDQLVKDLPADCLNYYLKK